MSASLLKTIASQTKSYAQKAISPHERIIDRIKTVRVESFEDVGEQLSVVGIDLETGKRLRMFREWSRSPRVKEANPLEKAFESVEPGGVIMFTDARKITGAPGENTYTSDGYVTLAKNDDTQDAELIHNVDAFVDAPESMPNGKKIQMFNVVRPERSEVFNTPEEFFRAFKEFFEKRESVDDSVVIRGYSEKEKATSSIRVLMAPTDTFRDRMTRFVEETHYIEMVGELEGTYEVTGRDLLNSLSDPENATKWEVIPISGVRKSLTVKDDPELSDRLEKKGDALFQNFVNHGEYPTTACRKVTLGIRHTSYGNGSQFRDVVAAFHAPGKARPLAMIDTPHVSGLDKVIPGYSAEQFYSAPDDTPEMDFSAYIEDLAGELNDTEFDFLDQPLEDPAPTAAQKTQANDEIDIDLSLFIPDPEPELEEPAGDEADATVKAEPAPEPAQKAPAPVDERTLPTTEPALSPAEEDIDFDLEIDLSAFDEGTSETPADAADLTTNAEADEAEDDLDEDFGEVDLSGLAAALPAEPEVEISPADDEDFGEVDLTDLNVEDEPFDERSAAEEENDDWEVDLSSLEEDPTPEPEAVPAPAVSPASKQDENSESSTVGFVELDDGSSFEDDFLSAIPESENSSPEVADDAETLASPEPTSEEKKDSVSQKSESEELIAQNFDAIAGAFGL